MVNQESNNLEESEERKKRKKIIKELFQELKRQAEEVEELVQESPIELLDRIWYDTLLIFDFWGCIGESCRQDLFFYHEINHEIKDIQNDQKEKFLVVNLRDLEQNYGC